MLACADSEGETGVQTPLEKSQEFRVCLQFLSRSPEKIMKLPSQHSMLVHYQHASETPFKWRFAGGPMMARL